MSVVHNERAKLLATALDNIAVGFLHLRERFGATAPHRLTPGRKGHA